jgi:hypothetical protein
MSSERSKFFLFLLVLCGGILLYMFASKSTTMTYEANAITASATPENLLAASSTVKKLPELVVTHLATPEPLRGAYMTSCIASGKKLREPLVKLIDATELNAIIIDIKDFSGKISFDVGDPRFVLNQNGCTIADIKEFIGELHKKNIYVIGRVTVMQDSVFPKAHPDAAVKKKDGSIWKDKKGLMFIDPGATEYWEYMVALGKASYAVGFDEINYDYIRFPSDGDMTDIVFTRTGSTTKANMMKKFYEYLGREMRTARIPTSADIFGMTTTNTDDLGIGQVLEFTLPNFDYVSPMVYPSHYPPMFNGWKDPNLVPYEIIKFSMSKAYDRANALERKESGYDDLPKVIATSTGTGTAVSGTTTPTRPPFVPTGKYANKLRPWIQDFDYGKEYTEVDVRAQKRGVYDSKLTSWMTWDPSNKYTPNAYDKAE